MTWCSLILLVVSMRFDAKIFWLDDVVRAYSIVVYIYIFLHLFGLPRQDYDGIQTWEFVKSGKEMNDSNQLLQVKAKILLWNFSKSMVGINLSKAYHYLYTVLLSKDKTLGSIFPQARHRLEEEANNFKCVVFDANMNDSCSWSFPLNNDRNSKVLSSSGHFSVFLLTSNRSISQKVDEFIILQKGWL